MTELIAAGHVHLHADDHPETLRLLGAMFAWRTDFDRLGYKPSDTGAWVHWDRLVDEAPISDTEVAVVLIARGCAILERHGGSSPAIAPILSEVVDLTARGVRR